MRGTDERSGSLFSYVDIEARVPAGHPLRRIRDLVNHALGGIGRGVFRPVCAAWRPSIAPERLMRASLLQMLYSIRSERQLMERLDFDLLFRWFVGLGIDDPVWDASTFSKNRDRLLTDELAQGFLSALLAEPRVKRLLSHEHFSVDGTLIKAWASMKSFRPRDGGGDSPDDGRNGERDFRGEKRSNETHASTTDPDARSTARLTARRAGCATWATRLWRTVMAWPLGPRSPTPRAPPNGKRRLGWWTATGGANAGSRWAATKAST